MPATTIKEVLNELDVIIEECIASNSRLGLFAYIYRRTTAEIASEIALGNFEDNSRLEVFDVAFAKLYLEAYYAHKNNQKLSAAWAYAFNQANAPLTIVQHILLGMNAHINLDLAIATASTMAGKEISTLEKDFNKVNDILFQITNELQSRLSRVSPLMFIIDWVGAKHDERFINFSMRKARGQSWNAANLLWSLAENDRKNAIDNLDRLTLKLSERIKSPKTGLVRFLIMLVYKFETKKLPLILSKLKAD